MNNNQNVEIFKQKWASCFFELTKKQGVIYWEGFASKSDIHTLTQAVEILKDQYKTRENSTGVRMKEPHLDDLKDVYWMLKNKDNRQHETDTCHMCMNSGWVKTVQVILNEKQIICSPSEIRAVPNGAMIGLYASPCTCHRSPREYSQRFKNQCISNSFGACGSGTGYEVEYMNKCIEKGGEENYKPETKAKDVVEATVNSPVSSINDGIRGNKALDGYVVG